MSYSSFVSKYKNLCTDKSTYAYFTFNNNYRDAGINYDLKQCEKICDNKDNCHAFFNYNNNCILYKNTLDNSGIDTYGDTKYISCSETPDYLLPKINNLNKLKDFYVNAEYYKNNKDKFSYLNPNLNHSKIINTYLKEINNTKKELANTSNSRDYLYKLYDNLIFFMNSISRGFNLDRNHLNSHLVNKNTDYSIDLKKNQLDDENDLNYIRYIHKLDDKMKTNVTLEQQKIVTKRSFTTQFIYYIVLALIMTIAIVTIIVYVMAPGIISDLTISSLLIGLIILMYFLHFKLKI